MSRWWGLGLLVLLGSCAGAQEGPLELTLVHMGDTHAQFDPVIQKVSGKKEPQAIGGLGALERELQKVREKTPQALVFHAGDYLQGTLYSVLFQGRLDRDFWNRQNLTAGVLGNHEFDKGPGFLAQEFLGKLNFPILGANLDFRKDPALRALQPKAYLVLEVQGQRIGVVGVTSSGTPQISSPGPLVRFTSPAKAVTQAVQDLERQGIHKIVVISHLGYEGDLDLAAQVSGVDVILGGHSSTLLGENPWGLRSRGPYPTVVSGPQGQRVLVAHAWDKARVLGVLKVQFDAQGNLTDWQGEPRFIQGPEAEEYRQWVQAYRAQVEVFKQKTLAMLSQDQRRGLNRGPGVQIAQSMCWRLGTQAALQNRGGVRSDLSSGPLTAAGIYDLLPFENTLVRVDLSGSGLKALLEEVLDRELRGRQTLSPGDPVVYAAGIRGSIDAAGKKGQRFRDLSLEVSPGQWAPLKPQETYSLAVNSFWAAGGDGLEILRDAPGKEDSGLGDAQVLVEFLQEKSWQTYPDSWTLAAPSPE